ncbi:MAG: hypothetical protein QGH11_08280, partial [Pirellulaceae bacterium]|nr:hypothetical protein [Pirellulaceae bacterium]
RCGTPLENLTRVPPPPPKKTPGDTTSSPSLRNQGVELGIQTQQPKKHWRPRQGMEPDSRHRSTIAGFAIGLLVLSVIEVIPAMVSIVQNSRLDEPEDLHNWVYLLLLIGFLQLAYACYLWQLPDFSSLWVVSLSALAVATLHAFLLAIRILAAENHSIIARLQLNLETLSPGKQAGWCLIILILFGTYCYFAGRTALKWQQRFRRK